MSSCAPGLVARLLAMAVRVYRRIPRLGPGRCRFAPTCSTYAIEALLRHGALRGLRLTLVRLAKCHPFHPGGVDRVPPRGVVAPRGPRQGVGP